MAPSSESESVLFEVGFYRGNDLVYLTLSPLFTVEALLQSSFSYAILPVVSLITSIHVAAQSFRQAQGRLYYATERDDSETCRGDVTATENILCYNRT